MAATATAVLVPSRGLPQYSSQTYGKSDVHDRSNHWPDEADVSMLAQFRTPPVGRPKDQALNKPPTALPLAPPVQNTVPSVHCQLSVLLGSWMPIHVSPMESVSAVERIQAFSKRSSTR